MLDGCSDRYTAVAADAAASCRWSDPMTAARHKALCHPFGCILCCSNVLKCPRPDQPIRMVIWTTVINHCKPYISFRRRQMNDQSKAVAFHPKHTVVPRAGKYWIVKVAEDGSRQTIERFDTEDAAVRRLRVLQEKARIVDRWNTPSPRPRHR